MNSSTKTRFKMGEKCPAKSNYKFDDCVDGTRTPSVESTTPPRGQRQVASVKPFP